MKLAERSRCDGVPPDRRPSDYFRNNIFGRNLNNRPGPHLDRVAGTFFAKTAFLGPELRLGVDSCRSMNTRDVAELGKAQSV